MAALSAEPDAEFAASPVADDDLFEWHFTMRGPPDSPYAGGLYHGRIMLPANYPFKPPDVMLLTPSGRFETNRKICVSVTSFHPEQWQPSWGVRLLLTALRAFMMTEAKGAIGGIDDCPDERRAQMARESHHWACQQCGRANAEILAPEPVPERSKEEVVDVAVADVDTPSPAPAAAADAGAIVGRAGAEHAGEPPAGATGAEAELRQRVVVPVVPAPAVPPPAADLPARAAPVHAPAPVPGVAAAVAAPRGHPQQQQVAARETPTIDVIMSILFAAIVVLLVRKLFAPDAVL